MTIRRTHNEHDQAQFHQDPSSGIGTGCGVLIGTKNGDITDLKKLVEAHTNRAVVVEQD